MPETTLQPIHKIISNAKLKQIYGLLEVGIMSVKLENSESLWIKVNDFLFIKSKSAMMGYLNTPNHFDKD